MDKKSFVEYFRKSVRMDSSSAVTDIANNFTDEDLGDIFEMSIRAHNPSYSQSNLPSAELYFVLLKAKQEVYYRLATSSAPFYPIEAEGASLRKDYKFEHYMSLVRRVEQEYNSLWNKYQSNQVIQVVDVSIDSFHYKRRNYNQANTPTISVKCCIPHEEALDIEWSKFSVFAGLFSCYRVYISEEPIYDEFEDEISPKAQVKAYITDIHRTKTRVKGLRADVQYHILITSEDRNGLKGFAETQCHTLPIPY